MEARREREKAKGRNGNGFGLSLGMAIQQWQTPAVADGMGGHLTRGGDRSDEMMLPGQAKHWPTPQAHDTQERGNTEADHHHYPHDLSNAASMWRTPDSPGAGGPRNRQVSRGNGHQTTIAEQAEAWATPTSRDWKDGADPSENVDTNSLLGRQAPRSMSDGQPSSPSTPNSRRQLNPLFVEWLMGWPMGWTSAAPSACDSRAMELYRCRLHMHFESLGVA